MSEMARQLMVIVVFLLVVGAIITQIYYIQEDQKTILHNQAEIGKNVEASNINEEIINNNLKTINEELKIIHEECKK